jgi:GT2 family glycosyltransferase
VSRPPVSVVFATCNHAGTVRAVLDALDTTDWPDLELIAIDCGSTDGSRELLRRAAGRPRRHPLRVVELPGAGRATALNFGFELAGRRDVVRLHADVVPDAADWLALLHDVLASRPDCGVVGAKITLAGGRIQTCGRRIVSGLGIAGDWSDLRWLEGDRDEASRPSEVDAVGGELCWIRREVLDATGGLDPGYDPVFGDDDDFCLLARWHGWSVFVEPAVRAVHYAPRTSTTTTPGPHDPDGTVQAALTARERLRTAHLGYFAQKWGFDPTAPDLDEIRRRYGHTRICWRIGERLCERLPERPPVDVCLVTWNSMAVLPRALEHLAATRWPDVRVWISDNGSTDGTLDWLEQRSRSFPFPLHVERLGQNVGVAQALNAAFVRGSAPVVARLDDDTIVPPEWLEALVPRFHQRPYAGCVSPKVLHDCDGDALQSGPTREFPGPFAGIGAQDHDRVDGLVRVVTMRGCCNVYRRSVFAEVSLLDPRFSPSQYDEWDHHIALRVTGYECLYDGSVAVRHLLTAGRMATPQAIGNANANLHKSDAKWGNRHWRALDRGIDLSIDGRLLPPDGDTAALRRRLPPPPTTPPAPLPRDPNDVAALARLARQRSRLRGADGRPAWWQDRIAAASAALDVHALDVAGVGITRLMDLCCHDADALLVLARYRRLDGDAVGAARTARWSRRLRPDDAALVAACRAIEAEPQPPARMPRRAVPVGDGPRVLLVPPLGARDLATTSAVASVRAALAAVGIESTVAHELAVDPRGYAAVHAFGLGAARDLVGRLQRMRAMAPRTRIVLSSLLPDPGPANWLGRHLGGTCWASDHDLGRLFAAAADVDPTERHDRREPHEFAIDYERRALEFVDALVVHSAGEAAWLRTRHPSLPPTHVLGEAFDGGGATPAWLDRVPRGAVVAAGERDLPGNHLPLVLALAGSGLPLALCGNPAYPFVDERTRRRGGDALHLLPQPQPDELAAVFGRAAVCAWLPAAPASFAVPLAAARAGAALVLAKGVGAEAVFGDAAHYVDPLDLPAVRAAAMHASTAPRPRPATAVSGDYGEALAAVLALASPAAV